MYSLLTCEEACTVSIRIVQARYDGFIKNYSSMTSVLPWFVLLADMKLDF